MCIFGIGLSGPLFSANSIIVLLFDAQPAAPLTRAWADSQHVDTLSLVSISRLTRSEAAWRSRERITGGLVPQGSLFVTVLGLAGEPEGLLAAAPERNRRNPVGDSAGAGATTANNSPPPPYRVPPKLADLDSKATLSLAPPN